MDLVPLLNFTTQRQYQEKPVIHFDYSQPGLHVDSRLFDSLHCGMTALILAYDGEQALIFRP